MINISRTVQYGLRGLKYLSENRGDGLIKIDRIAAMENIPENYLRKIFQQLIKRGILNSRKGPRGGVALSDRSSKISIAAVIEIIDGKPSLSECTLFGYPRCPRSDGCHLHSECVSFKNNLWEKLEKFYVEDL